MPQSTAYAPSLDEEFNGRISRAAESIRRDAQGRVCNDCRHVRNGWCASQVNVSGDSLTVLHPNAVACGGFEARS